MGAGDARGARQMRLKADGGSEEAHSEGDGNGNGNENGNLIRGACRERRLEMATEA